LLSLYGTKVKACITPAKLNQFQLSKDGTLYDEHAKFRSVDAKLLFLGKCERPDILLAVQFLCTKVKLPTHEDKHTLEKLLGYL
jgi:hypothetical protein